jgi:signal transduction histidine kinase
MDLFHVPTLILMTGVASFVPAVAIAVQPTTAEARRAQPWWATGFALLGIGWVLIGTRGLVPVAVSIFAGNAVLPVGFVMLILGFDRLVGHTARWWLAALAGVAVVGGFAALDALGWSSVNTRIVWTNLIGLVLCAEMARAVLRTSRRAYRRPGRIYLAILGVVAGVLMLRAVDAALAGRIASLMTAQGFHALSFFTYTITTLGMGIALLSIMNASLRAALQREVAMRDDIMSLIGHDLRTPFNSLLSGADVVRIYLEQDKPQAALDYLQTMRNAAAWAHNLLEDLLAWGHAQARAGTGTEARERVADVIADALGPNRPAMADKGITPDVDDGGLGVRVAPQAGRAMLRNLISNAVKHADPNTTVSIQAVPRAAGVEIAVQDDGPGLPDGLQRALASDRPPDEIRDAIRRTSGGLGLYLAAKIAETAGGRLLARTPAQGRGAVLAVWLPDA